MAGSAEEKQAFANAYSPIREHEREGMNHDLEDDLASSSAGCCCFRFGGWKRSNNHESRYLLGQQHEESWLVEKVKKVKEFTEMVAGPKWKNFVRKIGKHFKPGRRRAPHQGMYTPNSYALNFDNNGAEEEEEEEDDLFFTFSSRFSAQQRMPAES